MYGGVALFVLGALGSFWVTYDTAWADDPVVTYEVVTKDPPCTALRMESIGAVTRLTPLRDDYNLSEIAGGVPLFVQVPEDRASDVVQSLLEMPQVLGVQKADPSMTSNHTAPPLEIDSNSYINTVLADCYPAIPRSIEEALRDAIIQRDSAAGATSGSGLGESRERVIIFVHNITSVVAYLEENGAKVHGHSAGVYGGVTNSIHADIPVSLAVPLSERDDFHFMHAVSPIVSLGHGGGHTNNVTRVNTAENYAGGNDWSIRNPRTNNWLVVFGTGNDTTNQFGASAGQRVNVWLQWYDADNNNADLNLLVTGASQHTGVADQWGGTSAVPTESVTFVPASSGQWNISLAVIGTAVPDWIRLFIDGSTGDLEYHTSEGTITNPAESGNHGMPAADAPAASGAAYWSDLDNAIVELVITTHNPACTAAFLNHIDVTRLTDVRPHFRDGVRGYSADEYESGINVTAIIWPHQTNETVAAVVERTEVSRVAAYLHIVNATSPALNATSPEQRQLLALAINTNVEKDRTPLRCDPLSYAIAKALLDDVGWAGSPNAGPTGASDPDAKRDAGPVALTIDRIPISDLERDRDGTVHYGDLLGVGIGTNNVNATWAYLKENGALVTHVRGEDRQPGSYGYLIAFIRPLLVWDIIERDEVLEIQEYKLRRFGQPDYGYVNSEGHITTNSHPNRHHANSIHSSVEPWRRAGHRSDGVTIGVLDSHFMPDARSGLSSELPRTTPCDAIHGACDMSTDNYHGSAVAKIVLDMAPRRICT